ncbi:hypothetical protein BHM03_00022334 [Ensete ventricosum]|nr:hypothetical protein BHM03_00022334 [Ensete ventricosum]
MSSSSSLPQEVVKVKQMQHGKEEGLRGSASRRLPRMERARNEAVPEWKVKCLCADYGVTYFLSGNPCCCTYVFTKLLSEYVFHTNAKETASMAVKEEVAKASTKGNNGQSETKGSSGPPSRRPRKVEQAADEAVPEWKVQCLCNESSVPAIIRGSFLGGGGF